MIVQRLSFLLQEWELFDSSCHTHMYEYMLYLAVFAFYYRRYYYVKNLSKPERTRHVPGAVFNQHDKILITHIPYYTQLSYEGRQRFVGRLMRVNKEMNVQGRESLEITEEMRILIAASITQLTYGFKNPDIPFLKGVVVFPKIFYSKLAKAWVKGLSLGNGVVFLSWEDFLEGYRNSTDTYNLGLHEFTHALRFQKEHEEEFDSRLETYFEEWEQVGMPVFMRVKNGEEKFFRAYGGVNTGEFFSVCVENFFEIPDRFSKELPDLYYHLCYLLKQDPLNISGDYLFEEEEVAQANTKVKNLLPVYDVYRSEVEFSLFKIASKNWPGPFILACYFFMDLPVESKYNATRFILVSIAMIIAIRWKYYKDYRSILNGDYLAHFFKGVIPLIGLALVMYEVFFSFVN